MAKLTVTLKVGAVSETVSVSAALTNESPAVSLTVDRDFVEDMPLNARSFQDLIQLAPGAVSGGGGYYSIDGQRVDANNSPSTVYPRILAVSTTMPPPADRQPG